MEGTVRYYKTPHNRSYLKYVASAGLGLLMGFCAGRNYDAIMQRLESVFPSNKRLEAKAGAADKITPKMFKADEKYFQARFSLQFQHQAPDMNNITFNSLNYDISNGRETKKAKQK